MSTAFQVAPGPIYSAQKPTRCRAYRQFIKRFRCLVCHKKWGIDPCHTGPHGLSQKADDFTRIPLCRKHHDEMDAAPAKFVAKYRLDIPGQIRRFKALWNQRRSA